MRKFLSVLFIAVFADVICVQAQYQFVSPKPGSAHNNKETSITLRPGSYLDAASLQPGLVSVTGSKSGIHEVRLVLATDGKTVVAYPKTAFFGGEEVTVAVAPGLRTVGGKEIEGFSFSFSTHPDWSADQIRRIREAQMVPKLSEYGESYSGEESGLRGLCDNIAAFSITDSGGWYDAPVWYYTFSPFEVLCFSRTIITPDGDSILHQQDNDLGIDFKINHNGYITFFNSETNEFLMADSSYVIIDSFQMGNGYLADEHDFQIFPNGDRLMFCYDAQPYDLSPWGGLDSATVIGVVVQKLDANDNVVFEWKTWDYFDITDAAFWVQSGLPNTLSYDWVHSNAIELEPGDTTILLSSRSFCEITKISLQTGAIKWRWGGNNNEFTHINDDGDKYNAADGSTYYFSGQHDVRRLPNGNILFFNNDNNLIPMKSSAKEYVLDEVNKTATLVWQYIHPQVNGFNLYANAMGNVMHLPNGNYFINWGLILSNQNQPFPKFSEVDSAGNVRWEFIWTVDTPYYCSYRAFKYLWDRCNLIPESSLASENVTETTADLSWEGHSKISEYALEYRECGSLTWMSIPLSVTGYSLSGLNSNTCYEWRVLSVCAVYGDSFYTSIQTFTTGGATGLNGSGLPLTELNLFPNPAGSETDIRFMVSSAGTVHIRLYDITGVLLRSVPLEARAGNNSYLLNLEGLSAGTYRVELSAGGFPLQRGLVKH